MAPCASPSSPFSLQPWPLAAPGHDALTYCEHAVQLAPDVAAVHDSYEVAPAGDHQCDAARRERAIAQRLDPVSVDLQRPINCRPR